MTRTRFIIAQGIWFLLVAITLIAQTSGDSQAPIGNIIALLAVLGATSVIMQWGENKQNQTQRFNPNLGTLIRAGATAFFWLTYLGAVSFAISAIGSMGLVLAFILFLPLIPISLATWGVMGGASDNEAKIAQLYADSNKENANPEKRKRDTLDSVLRDLSDEDLMRLRERLQQGYIDDDVLYDRIVGDDGELVNYN